MSVGVMIRGWGGIGGRFMISRLRGMIGGRMVGLCVVGGGMVRLCVVGGRMMGLCVVGGRVMGVGMMRVLGGMHEGILVGILVQLV